MSFKWMVVMIDGTAEMFIVNANNLVTCINNEWECKKIDIPFKKAYKFMNKLNGVRS